MTAQAKATVRKSGCVVAAAIAIACTAIAVRVWAAGTSSDMPAPFVAWGPFQWVIGGVTVGILAIFTAHTRNPDIHMNAKSVTDLVCAEPHADIKASLNELRHDQQVHTKALIQHGIAIGAIAEQMGVKITQDTVARSSAWLEELDVIDASVGSKLAKLQDLYHRPHAGERKDEA